DAAAGDPMLAAVDDETVAAPVRARRHFARRAARPGLGDADRGLVALQHEPRRQPLLLLRPIAHDRADRAHVGFDDDAAGDAAALRHLLDDQHGVEIGQALPAIGARERHPEEAGLDQLFDGIPRVLFRPIHLGGARQDVAAGERARPFFELSLALIEAEIHVAPLALYLLRPEYASERDCLQRSLCARLRSPVSGREETWSSTTPEASR